MHIWKSQLWPRKSRCWTAWRRIWSRCRNGAFYFFVLRKVLVWPICGGFQILIYGCRGTLYLGMISCSVRGKERKESKKRRYLYTPFLVDARLVANGAFEERYAHHPIGFAYGLYLQHLLRSWPWFSQKLVFIIWIFRPGNSTKNTSCVR